MKGKIWGMICLSAVALMVCGCGSEIPDMTDQQTEIVTEYAANTMLVHMPGTSSSRLVDTSVDFDPSKMSKYEKKKLGIPIEDMQSPAPVVTEESGESQEDQNTEQTENEGAEDAGTQVQEPEEPALSVSDVMEIPGLEVRLDGYSVLDSYPEAGEGTDLYFAMDASEGKKLLVVRLAAVNGTSDQIVFNTVMRTDLHYTLIVNGGESEENAMVTLLTDDFSALNETIEPGGSVSGVLIGQIPADSAGNINSVQVRITSDVGKTILSQ